MNTEYEILYGYVMNSEADGVRDYYNFIRMRKLSIRIIIQIKYLMQIQKDYMFYSSIIYRN